jgi:hypothetical protein
MINEFRTFGGMRIHWGSQITRRKPTPVPLHTTNPRCPDLVLNPGHCDGKPVANCLSYGTICGASYGSVILDVCCSSVATQSRNMVVYLHPHDKLLHLWKFLLKFVKNWKDFIDSLSLCKQIGFYVTDSNSTRAIVFIL